MTITLYNRKVLGTASKPLIPNYIFKETLISLDEGDLDLYELVREEYTFEAAQKSLAEEKYAKVKNGKLHLLHQ